MLRLIFRKGFWLGTVLVLGLELVLGIALPFVSTQDISSLGIQFWWSPFVCIASFTLGLCVARLANCKKQKPNKFELLISALVLLIGGKILHTLPFMLASALAYQMTACSYFLIADLIAQIYQESVYMRNLGKLALCKVAKTFTSTLARISYQFYLFQYVVIYQVLSAAATALAGRTIYTFSCLELLFICFVLTYLLALVLEWLEGRIREYISTSVA